jgi:DNA ligase (NAD+)
LVSTVADLYHLAKADLLALDGFAEKKARNLMSAIELSKSRPLNQLITGLGIRFVGQTIARTLSANVSSMDELLDMPDEELLAIEGIGPEIARSIRDWASIDSNRHLIKLLQESGVNTRRLEDDVPDSNHGALAGKTLVLTGTLPSMSRTEAAHLIKQAGGKVTSSVSRSTSFVVVGDSPGSKAIKAAELQIPVLEEAELLALLR